MLVWIALLACACLPAPAPQVVSPSPETSAGIGGISRPSVWVYAGALFLPPDPNTYSDVIFDAQPLADGGWIVLHAPTARPRFNCDPGSFGCALMRPPLARMQRVDAAGRVV